MFAALAVQEGICQKKPTLGYHLEEHDYPRISRTDQQFEDKGLEFVWGMEELSIDELNDLFLRVSLFCRSLHSDATLRLLGLAMRSLLGFAHPLAFSEELMPTAKPPVL